MNKSKFERNVTQNNHNFADILCVIKLIDTIKQY